MSRHPLAGKAHSSDGQLLLMLKVCLDAESRCDERIRDASARGDTSAATADTQLKEQYVSLRYRLSTEIGELTTQDLHEQLQQLPHLLSKSGSAEQS